MTVLWSNYEVTLIVVLPPAALTIAEELHTVITVGIDSSRLRRGDRVDDLAEGIASIEISSLTTSPSTTAALFLMNWCICVL